MARSPRPSLHSAMTAHGIRMAEDRGVLLDALVDARHEADVVVRLGERRPQQVDAVLGVQMTVHRVHRARGRARAQAASDTTAHVLLSRKILPSSLSCVPILTPFAVMPRMYHSPSHSSLSQAARTFSASTAIPARVRRARPRNAGGLDEGAQRPVVQEGHHGALAAAQVQAVVPVGAQALADAGAAHLLGGKIERALEVLVDRRLALVGERDDFVEEARRRRSP